MSITSSSVSTSGLIRKLSSIAPLVQSRCVRSFRVSCFIWCASIFSSCCARRSLASPLASSRLSFSSFSFITAALLLGEQRVNTVRFSHTPAHPQDQSGVLQFFQGTLDGYGASGQGRRQLHNGETDKQYPVGILRTHRKGGVQQAGIHDLCGAADRQPQHGGGKWHTGRQNGICGHKFKFHLVGFLLSLGSFGQVTGAVDHDSPEALFALMLTLPAQVVVGHTPPVIEEEGQLQLPFLAHSRHGASYHRKSAHFSRNGRDGRIAVFGVMFRGDFQGKYGHRAAWKSPIVSRTGQTTPRRFVMFG